MSEVKLVPISASEYEAMTLLEDEVKKLGYRHIGLHVFGHNKVARNLYESLGYEITNLNMEKVLS